MPVDPLQPPSHRRGPRPLMLHLALSLTKQNASGFAWPTSNADWQNLIVQLQQSALAASLPNGAKPALLPDPALIHGIAAYRRHPYRRTLVDPPPIWREGESELREYPIPDGVAAVPAPPVLIVPSLVNRSTILDLSEGRSLCRGLAAHGLRVLLLDWGWPDAEARRFDLEAVIAGRLARAIDFVGRPTLMGYCMGGLLALAAAQLKPDKVAGLALLATPWDFHVGQIWNSDTATRLLEHLEPVMKITGTLPVDALQVLFNLAEPHSVGDKYREFGADDQTADRAAQFVAFEDWLNDGVPLAAPIARQTLGQWYGENVTMKGAWTIGGEAILPAKIKVPCLAALAMRDRIVPIASGLPLAARLPGCVLLKPEAGHVGMIAGSSAETQLWGRLAKWARAIPYERGFSRAQHGANVTRARTKTRREKPE
jgi:polyhydroxyalkanoate synthase subunit PhaC